MSYIYKITNDVNNKVYIGKTDRTIKQRFNEHLKDRYRFSFEKRPLYEAMNKYGAEHFNIELIEECSQEEACDREIHWIEQYNSYIGFENSNGYNATTGGDGKQYAFTTQQEIEKLIKLYNENKSISEISQILNHDVKTISNKLKDLGFEIRSSNFYFSKKVYQLDKNTKQILNEFNSVAEAGRFINVSDSTHIAAVCRGTRKSAYGYCWCYKDKYNEYIKNNNKIN